jgi:hypothetical protein
MGTERLAILKTLAPILQQLSKNPNSDLLQQTLLNLAVALNLAKEAKEAKEKTGIQLDNQQVPNERSDLIENLTDKLENLVANLKTEFTGEGGVTEHHSFDWQRLSLYFMASKDPIVFYTDPPQELVSPVTKQLLDDKQLIKSQIEPRLNLQKGKYLPSKLSNLRKLSLFKKAPVLTRLVLNQDLRRTGKARPTSPPRLKDSDIKDEKLDLNIKYYDGIIVRVMPKTGDLEFLKDGNRITLRMTSRIHPTDKRAADMKYKLKARMSDVIITTREAQFCQAT